MPTAFVQKRVASVRLAYQDGISINRVEVYLTQKGASHESTLSFSRFASGAVVIVLCALNLTLTINSQQAQRLESSRWQGQWTTGASPGYSYDGDMNLIVDARNRVEGTILWTLRRSPHSEEESRIGMSATEYVTGRYYPNLPLLILGGTRKADPNEIIDLDNYRLLLADNGQTLTGITETQGTWQGRYSARRRLPPPLNIRRP